MQTRQDHCRGIKRQGRIRELSVQEGEIDRKGAQAEHVKGIVRMV